MSLAYYFIEIRSNSCRNVKFEKRLIFGIQVTVFSLGHGISRHFELVNSFQCSEHFPYFRRHASKLLYYERQVVFRHYS